MNDFYNYSFNLNFEKIDLNEKINLSFKDRCDKNIKNYKSILLEKCYWLAIYEKRDQFYIDFKRLISHILHNKREFTKLISYIKKHKNVFLKYEIVKLFIVKYHEYFDLSFFKDESICDLFFKYKNEILPNISEKMIINNINEMNFVALSKTDNFKHYHLIKPFWFLNIDKIKYKNEMFRGFNFNKLIFSNFDDNLILYKLFRDDITLRKRFYDKYMHLFLMLKYWFDEHEMRKILFYGEDVYHKIVIKGDSHQKESSFIGYLYKYIGNSKNVKLFLDDLNQKELKKMYFETDISLNEILKSLSYFDVNCCRFFIENRKDDMKVLLDSKNVFKILDLNKNIFMHTFKYKKEIIPTHIKDICDYYNSIVNINPQYIFPKGKTIENTHTKILQDFKKLDSMNKKLYKEDHHIYRLDGFCFFGK